MKTEMVILLKNGQSDKLVFDAMSAMSQAKVLRMSLERNQTTLTVHQHLSLLL